MESADEVAVEFLNAGGNIRCFGSSCSRGRGLELGQPCPVVAKHVRVFAFAHGIGILAEDAAKVCPEVTLLGAIGVILGGGRILRFRWWFALLWSRFAHFPLSLRVNFVGILPCEKRLHGGELDQLGERIDFFLQLGLAGEEFAEVFPLPSRECGFDGALELRELFVQVGNLGDGFSGGINRLIAKGCLIDGDDAALAQASNAGWLFCRFIFPAPLGHAGRLAEG